MFIIEYEIRFIERVYTSIEPIITIVHVSKYQMRFDTLFQGVEEIEEKIWNYVNELGFKNFKNRHNIIYNHNEQTVKVTFTNREEYTPIFRKLKIESLNKE